MNINEDQHRALRRATQDIDPDAVIRAKVLNEEDRLIALRKVARQVGTVFFLSALIVVILLLLISSDAPGKSIMDEPAYLIFGAVGLGLLGYALGHWMGALNYPADKSANIGIIAISSDVEGLILESVKGEKQCVRWENLKVLQVAITRTRYGPFLKRLALATDEGFGKNPVLFTIDPILLAEGDRLMAVVAAQLLERMNQSEILVTTDE